MKIEQKNLPNMMVNPRNARNIVTRALPGSDEVFALANTPDVRASEVARGKALVANPNYPTREQTKQIARLLAARWPSGGSGPTNPISSTQRAASRTGRARNRRSNAATATC